MLFLTLIFSLVIQQNVQTVHSLSTEEDVCLRLRYHDTCNTTRGNENDTCCHNSRVIKCLRDLGLEKCGPSVSKTLEEKIKEMEKELTERECKDTYFSPNCFYSLFANDAGSCSSVNNDKDSCKYECDSAYNKKGESLPHCCQVSRCSQCLNEVGILQCKHAARLMDDAFDWNNCNYDYDTFPKIKCMYFYSPTWFYVVPILLTLVIGGAIGGVVFYCKRKARKNSDSIPLS